MLRTGSACLGAFEQHCGVLEARWHAGVREVLLLAPNDRSAEEQVARPANPPVLPAPQKADADPGHGPGLSPQVRSTAAADWKGPGPEASEQ